MQNEATPHDVMPFFAVVELILVFPAALFMAALFVRNIQPPPYEPAQTARRIVEWFALRSRLGLEVFLMALPFTALVMGCVVVLRRWMSDAALRQAASDTFAAIRGHLATIIIFLATLSAAGILGVVGLHVMTS